LDEFAALETADRSGGGKVEAAEGAVGGDGAGADPLDQLGQHLAEGAVWRKVLAERQFPQDAVGVGARRLNGRPNFCPTRHASFLPMEPIPVTQV
jgi:hypothetical protein